MNDYKEVERITELHKRYAKKPTDPVERFIHEIGFLDERYKGYKFADKWMMDKDVLLAVRERLLKEQPRLF